MPPRLKITNTVIDRLSRVKERCTGWLYGIWYDGTLLVVGFDTKLGLESERTTDLLKKKERSYGHIRYNYPTEVDLCGLVTNEETPEDEMRKTYANTLEQIDLTDNPLLLNCQINDSGVKAHFYINEKLLETPYEVIHESDLWKQFLHVRLRSNLPFVCEVDPMEIKDTLRSLRKKIAAGMLAFTFPKTDVYLIGGDVETSLSGLSGEPTVGELWEMSVGCKSQDNLVEGCNSRKGKKNKNKTRDVDILTVKLLMKPTREIRSESQLKPAPVIQHIKSKLMRDGRNLRSFFESEVSYKSLPSTSLCLYVYARTNLSQYLSSIHTSSFNPKIGGSISPCMRLYRSVLIQDAAEKPDGFLHIPVTETVGVGRLALSTCAVNSKQFSNNGTLVSRASSFCVADIKIIK